MPLLEPILSQITQVFAAINQDHEDPIKLLEHGNRLTTILYSLGDLWVNARADADHKATQYRDALDDTFLELKREGYTIEEAKALARKKHRDLLAESEEAATLALKLGTLRDSVSKKVSLLQSYAAELRSERTFTNAI